MDRHARSCVGLGQRVRQSNPRAWDSRRWMEGGELPSQTGRPAQHPCVVWLYHLPLGGVECRRVSPATDSLLSRQSQPAADAIRPTRLATTTSTGQVAREEPTDDRHPAAHPTRLTPSPLVAHLASSCAAVSVGWRDGWHRSYRSLDAAAAEEHTTPTTDTRASKRVYPLPLVACRSSTLGRLEFVSAFRAVRVHSRHTRAAASSHLPSCPHPSAAKPVQPPAHTPPAHPRRMPHPPVRVSFAARGVPPAEQRASAPRR